MDIFLNILLLIVGMVLLVKGADFFVDGASDIAKKLGIPSLIIGLTLVSIGTSLPEASVSINAAITQSSDLSFGNVIGSNIFNSFFIIGVCSMILPTVVSKDIMKFDTPILFGVMAILALFAYAITPFTIDRWEAAILFVIFVAYIILAVLRALKQRKLNASMTIEDSANTEEDSEEENPTKERKTWLSIIFVILGLAGVVGGGTLVVNSAKALALSFGMSELLVGLTIVAIGTSLPELVTSLVASKKGENDIAVGNVIGSNIFNIIFILGFSGMINPLTLTANSYIDVIFMVLAILLIFLFALKKGKVNRIEGTILMIIYILYVTYTILRDTGVLVF